MDCVSPLPLSVILFNLICLANVEKKLKVKVNFA